MIHFVALSRASFMIQLKIYWPLSATEYPRAVSEEVLRTVPELFQIAPPYFNGDYNCSDLDR